MNSQSFEFAENKFLPLSSAIWRLRIAEATSMNFLLILHFCILWNLRTKTKRFFAYIKLID